VTKRLTTLKGLVPYRGYVFRAEEQDPIVDALKTAWADSGDSFAEVSERSGVSAGTPRKWFSGKTRRPQFATVAAFAIACGKTGIIFGRDGHPRLVGRVIPAEDRAFTGTRRKKTA
jgi:hypothetical protein